MEWLYDIMFLVFSVPGLALPLGNVFIRYRLE